MQINPDFLDGNDYWQEKVLSSCNSASQILSRPEFIERIKSWPKFDSTDETPAQIADTLQGCAIVYIQVGFYSKCLTKAIAYEENGAVYFNMKKESYGAGSPGNVAHEAMHALGYRHNGNSAAGNENSVPYRIGQWVDELSAIL